EQMVLAVNETTNQLWVYRLPQRQLAVRDDLSAELNSAVMLNPNGDFVQLTLELPSHGPTIVRWENSAKEPQSFVLQSGPGFRFWLAGEWLVVGETVVGTHGKISCVLRWRVLKTGVERIRVQWLPDAMPNVRPYTNEWLVFDHCGRVL